eukprot:gene12475-biopygen16332
MLLKRRSLVLLRKSNPASGFSSLGDPDIHARGGYLAVLEFAFRRELSLCRVIPLCS